MSRQEKIQQNYFLLVSRIRKDLRRLNIPDFKNLDFEVKSYSKTFYAQYLPVGYKGRESACIYLYPISSSGNNYPYEKVFLHVIHEVSHHIQYTRPSFVRLRGVMHDPEFWGIYNDLKDKAVMGGVIREEDILKYENDKISYREKVRDIV